MSNEEALYAEVDLDEAEREYAATARGMSVMKLKPGRNVLRILPPRPGNKLPFTKFLIHGLGSGPSYRSFQCPGDSCPVCAEVSRLNRTGNEADRNAAKEMRTKVEVYCNVIDISDKDRAVQVLKLAEGTYRDLLNFMRGDEKLGEPAVNFCHPVSGMNVIIHREGEGKQTRYKCELSRSGPKPMEVVPGSNKPDSAKINEKLGAMKDLSEAVRALLPETIMGLLSGGGAVDVEHKQLGADPDLEFPPAAGGSIADDPDLA